MRQDRRYCESSFFRSRIVPDSDALHSAETCRAVVATRNVTCYKVTRLFHARIVRASSLTTLPLRAQECDVCDAFCSSGLARAVKDVVKCTIDMPLLGITAAAHSSDAGQQISYGHGAIRTKGRPYTPYTGYLEQFDILVNNDIDRPRVNRDSVSCRRPHRESRTGAFVPGLDNNGKPKKRTGFMVSCSTSSDCYSRCGEHPLSGFSYVCTPHPLFYTFHVVNETLTEETLAIELAAQDLSPGIPVTADFDSFDTRLALLEARPKWIPKPDTVSTQSYFVDEPGACFGHDKTIAFLKLTLRSVLIFVTHRREQV